MQPPEKQNHQQWQILYRFLCAASFSFVTFNGICNCWEVYSCSHLHLTENFIIFSFFFTPRLRLPFSCHFLVCTWFSNQFRQSSTGHHESHFPFHGIFGTIRNLLNTFWQFEEEKCAVASFWFNWILKDKQESVKEDAQKQCCLDSFSCPYWVDVSGL